MQLVDMCSEIILIFNEFENINFMPFDADYEYTIESSLEGTVGPLDDRYFSSLCRLSINQWNTHCYNFQNVRFV